MKVIMYFVRHGQTRLNEKGRMQGVCDSPLTTQGELQVEKTPTKKPAANINTVLKKIIYFSSA